MRRWFANPLSPVPHLPKQSTWPQKSFIYLDEVTLRSRAEAGEECTRALALDDLLEAADEALVVLDRVQLDAGLHDIHWREGTMGDGAADAAGERALKVVLRPNGPCPMTLPSSAPAATAVGTVLRKVGAARMPIELKSGIKQVLGCKMLSADALVVDGASALDHLGQPGGH